MRTDKRWSLKFSGIFAATILLCIFSGCALEHKPVELNWPAATKEARPWTYWWWMGNAVNKEGISKHLEMYRKAGMGGVQINPIYGAKGYEDRFHTFLSPEWMEVFGHTVAEGKRLDMGVCLSPCESWPFGGPQVGPEEAAKKVICKIYSLTSGSRLTETVQEKGELQTLMAYSEDGQIVNLTGNVDENGILAWIAPPGKWELYAVFQGWTGMNIKRPVIGGEGKVVDPFSSEALQNHLKPFDKVFSDYPHTVPDAFYHDSFEYYGANWTNNFLEEFKTRRGYDLRGHLPAFLGRDSDDKVARVKSDYRQTISELLEQFLLGFKKWANDQGAITYNQAQGSPGNLIDIYADADIPQTEIFGPSGFELPGLRTDPQGPKPAPDILFTKFCSSAIHTAGRNLASAETCTWLAEHFQVSLAQIKPEIDALFVGGVNHLTYHGMTYSPEDVPWPGWRYYATVNFGHTNSFWRDVPALNAYVTRCQSILQTGKPANDILLYFPIQDIWHNKEGMLKPLQVHNLEGWLYGSEFYKTAKRLWEKGYTFDYVSDKILGAAGISLDKIQFGEVKYRVVVVPKCRFLPSETLEKLVGLAREGATIIAQNESMPDVPGFGNLEMQREHVATILSSVNFIETEHQGIREARIGKGRILNGDNLEMMLTMVRVYRETMVDTAGIELIRQTHSEGYHYFVANIGKETLDRWIQLGVKAKSVVILDPRYTSKSGLAAIRQSKEGFTEIYLQLHPGESCILRTFSTREIDGPKWNYLVETDPPNGLPIVQLSDYDYDMPIYKSFPKGFNEIKGVRIKEVSTECPGQEAKCLIDGSGLNAHGSHSRIQTTMWLSAQVEVSDQYVTFDLGGLSDVDAVMIWNYNENETRPVMDRGVSELDILVSSDNVTYKNLGRFTLRQAPGTQDVNFSQIFPLTSKNIRYVKLDVKTSRSEEGYVGLSEVRFSGKSLAATPPVVSERSLPQIINAKGTWKVTFIEGGPTLPVGFETDTLASWTKLGDEQAQRFAGTALYTITFDKPAGDVEEWVLDLGKVCESARIRLNGKSIGTLWSIPFTVPIGQFLKQGKNVLEVEVTNLTANRVADLDRRKIPWKNFYNINFASIKYRHFDASGWPPMDSGLLGPVRLIPTYVSPDFLRQEEP